jgi:8-oxo-dGTP pyrophosphatase MutT (NUDIX family)
MSKQVVVGILSQILNGDVKFLLVTSIADYGEYSGCYYPPGGHVDEGEGLEQALIREFEEELGLEIVVGHKIDETPADIEGEVAHWYSCSCKDWDTTINSAEIQTYGFFSLDEMKGMHLWPATRDFFKRHFNLQTAV